MPEVGRYSKGVPDHKSFNSNGWIKKNVSMSGIESIGWIPK